VTGPGGGRFLPFAALILFGAGWGITQPLGKIAVSTGHGAFGLVFWQLVVVVLVLGAITLCRRRPLPMAPADLRLYAAIALIGTVLPGAASYEAVRHLPSGVVSILLSLVPMFALPIALCWGIERFAAPRALGILLGAVAVVMIGAPRASLPEPGMVVFLPLAMVAPFFYGLEGNVVARFGTRGLGPVRLLLGAALVGLPMAAALALLGGQWVSPAGPWGPPERAVVLSGLIHAVVYAGYVWLVGRAGAVFAAQVAYLVTLFGVGWAMLILGERYSGWVWAAMAVMLGGLALVQPRPGARPARPPARAGARPPETG
jgi:drug/metabolite transporter (DMT)-like permease